MFHNKRMQTLLFAIITVLISMTFIPMQEAWAKKNETVKIDRTNIIGVDEKLKVDYNETYNYQWFVNGTEVSTESYYQPTTDDYEKWISVTAYLDSKKIGEDKIYFSKLPVVYIDTKDSEPINSKETYISAEMNIQCANGSKVQKYSGKVEIKGRGNSTWGQPKKPYKLKLDKKADLINSGKNKHYVLLANYLDESLMRNTIASNISNEIGLVTMDTDWVDVVLNGKYIGNYQLCEHIRVDEDRVPVYDWGSTIDEINEKDQSNITGGYLFELSEEYDEISKFQTPLGLKVMVNSPEEVCKNSDMWNYIQSFWINLEHAYSVPDGYTTIDGIKHHYTDFLDLDSLAGYWLVNEILGNNDAVYKSRYAYLDKDSKLKFGPVWDFDWGCGSAVAGNYPTGWKISKSDISANFFKYFLRDQQFCELACEKYHTLQPYLRSIVEENGFLDEKFQYLKESGEANEVLWKFDRGFGYDNEVLMDYLTKRLDWLDIQFENSNTLMKSTALSNLPTKHIYSSDWSVDDTYHWHAPICGHEVEVSDKEEHSGGIATCQAKKICEVCGQAYGDISGHDFKYYVEDNNLIAFCQTENCSEEVTLSLSASSANYSGSEAYIGASFDVGELGAFNTATGLNENPTITYYKVDTEGATTGGTLKTAAEVRKAAGNYYAKATIKEKSLVAAFKVNKIAPVADDFTYTAPTSLTYDGNAKAAVVAAKTDKTNGIITVKYYDSTGIEVEAPKNVGTYTVKVTVTAGDNYNAVTTPIEVGTFTITKGTYTGTKTATGNLLAKNGRTVTVELPELPEGASYGTVSNTNTDFFTVASATDGKVTVTSAKDWDKTTETEGKTFTIPVTGADNYNDYSVTVTIVPNFHEHDWEYSLVGTDTIKAHCKADSHNGDDVTLTITVSNNVYSGNTVKATVDKTAWEAAGFAVPDVVYEAKTGSTLTDGNAVNAGTYTAMITVDDKVATKDFEITKAIPTISTVPTASAITYGETLADSTLTGGEANVTGTFAWTSGATKPLVADSGKTEYEVTFTPADTDNYDVATCKIKVEVNKADYTDTELVKTVSVNLQAKKDKSAEVDLSALPEGASYGDVTNANTELFTVGAITDGKVTITAAKNFAAEDMEDKTFTVAVDADSNHNNAVVTVTVRPFNKKTQTITAENVTVAYGDTGKSISAVTTTGGGALSYTLKSGDAVEVDAVGALTIKKAGTAVITVNAAENDEYEAATKDVTVTVDKGEISPSVSITRWKEGEDANRPSVSGNAGNGEVTYKYKPKSAADTAYSTDVPTGAGEYTLKAEIAETGNYMGGIATVDFVIAEAPTVTPTVTPTDAPSSTPTGTLTDIPTGIPTGTPTGIPTGTPTDIPTGTPSSTPTDIPTGIPTGTPTGIPTGTPTDIPTGTPSSTPTGIPTGTPSGTPTEIPSGIPTEAPSGTPTKAPIPSPVNKDESPATSYDTIITKEISIGNGNKKGITIANLTDNSGSGLNGVVTVNDNLKVTMLETEWKPVAYVLSRVTPENLAATKWIYAEGNKEAQKELKKLASVKFSKGKNQTLIKSKQNKKVAGGVYAILLSDGKGNTIYMNIECIELNKNIKKTPLKVNNLTAAPTAETILKAAEGDTAKTIGLTMLGSDTKSEFNSNAVEWIIGSGKKAVTLKHNEVTEVKDGKGKAVAYLTIADDGSIKMVSGAAKGSIKITGIVNGKKYKTTVNVKEK